MTKSGNGNAGLIQVTHHVRSPALSLQTLSLLNYNAIPNKPIPTPQKTKPKQQQQNHKQTNPPQLWWFNVLMLFQDRKITWLHDPRAPKKGSILDKAFFFFFS